MVKWKEEKGNESKRERIKKRRLLCGFHVGETTQIRRGRKKDML